MPQMPAEHEYSPKHGKMDPTGAPHVGGGTWAGGSGNFTVMNWFLLPPAYEVWGEVMFSHASVILSTGQAPPPPRYGQQACSTYPTGMHTCLRCIHLLAK